MDNLFIIRLIHWGQFKGVELTNKVLSKFRAPLRLKRDTRASGHMTSVEHRMNLFHLIEQVCAYRVPGDVVEFGTFVGETALVMAKVLQHYADKALQLYDSFEMGFGSSEDPRERLVRNFHWSGVNLPTIHDGKFEDTIPSELPEQVAFCHIDCGYGGDAIAHRDVVHTLLEQVYPRVSPGGIILLMDYADPAEEDTWNGNMGVKLACDRFFVDKPEKVGILVAGDGARGYVRKALA